MRKFLPALLLLLCVSSKAQLTNSGNLQVQSGASMTSFGDLANSGTWLNNGTVYLKGNLSNSQASMSAGSGTLQLNGSSAQVVDGTQAFSTYNLITNNAAGITLNNNLSVSGMHTFSNGIITASSNYLVYTAAASYTGDNDSKHVNGWVKKFGTTSFTFPVGNGTYERTIAIAGLSAVSEFNAKYSGTTPNTSQLQLPLVMLQPAEHWIINRVSGGTASVIMNWDNNKVALPNWNLSEITSASYVSGNWAGVGGVASGNVATTGTITSNSVSSFNYFTLASSIYTVSQMLINFTATKKKNYTEINWETVNEQNVNHFIVERSDDNANYYSIGQVPGGKNIYTVNDVKPVNRIAYYRLRTVDNDLRDRLSKVVIVTDGVSAGGIALLANPVRDKIILVADGSVSGLFSYNIYTDNGQLAQQGSLSINGRYELALKALAKGNYFLTLKNASGSYNFKVRVD